VVSTAERAVNSSLTACLCAALGGAEVVRVGRALGKVAGDELDALRIANVTYLPAAQGTLVSRL
jgi:hypothetical protein